MVASLLLLLAAQSQSLAVLELKNKIGDKEIDAAYLTDVVRSAALQTAPGLKVMTRENILVLLEASGKKLAECEGECEVDTGRRLGADLVITGEVLKFGKSYKLNLRLHETRGAQLLSGAQASGATPEELDKGTRQAVIELLAPLRAPAMSKCMVTLPAEGCPKHPEVKGVLDDDFEGAGKSQAKCLLRPAQFHNWCGNTQVVSATFTEDGKPVASRDSRRRCDITFAAEGCPARRDDPGLEPFGREGGTWDNADLHLEDDPPACLRRATEWVVWCRSTQPVTARAIDGDKVVASATTAQGCRIDFPAEGCPAHPELKGSIADVFDGSEHDRARCLRRAAEFWNWCKSTQEVSATFLDGGKAASRSTRRRCEITLPPEGCPAQRDWAVLQPYARTGGTFAENWDGADDDPARCMRRASDYVSYCANTEAVVARFLQDGNLVSTRRADTRCEIALAPEGCPAHRESAGVFHDGFEGADVDGDRCLRRAAEWRSWCGLQQPVTATFIQAGKRTRSTTAR